jgi:hypothetical protein
MIVLHLNRLRLLHKLDIFISCAASSILMHCSLTDHMHHYFTLSVVNHKGYHLIYIVRYAVNGTRGVRFIGLYLLFIYYKPIAVVFSHFIINVLG